jgi:hypothetical protein
VIESWVEIAQWMKWLYELNDRYSILGWDRLSVLKHVIYFFIIKRTRCTDFTKFILAWNSTCFGQFHCPSSGVYSLYTRHWYISYRFVDSSKDIYKPVWHTPLPSVQWINSWSWTEGLSETCRVSCQNKICEISASSFIIKKFVTMHGYMNVKYAIYCE